jgi:hypothetical protein
MAHPLLEEINRIRQNPNTEAPDTKQLILNDIPFRPLPEHQRQQLILQYMNAGDEVRLINLIRDQVRAEEYWGNRND